MCFLVFSNVVEGFYGIKPWHYMTEVKLNLSGLKQH